MNYTDEDDIDINFPTESDEEILLLSDDDSIMVITDEDEQEVLRADTPQTCADTTSDDGTNEDETHDTIQDSIYEPLRKHENFFKELQKRRPDIIADLWAVHDRVIESTRRRPCILHKTPGLACLGKAKIPYYKPARTGYVTIQDRQTLLDEGTQTKKRTQLATSTQTARTHTKTAGTQTTQASNNYTTTEDTRTMRASSAHTHEADKQAKQENKHRQTPTCHGQNAYSMTPITQTRPAEHVMQQSSTPTDKYRRTRAQPDKTVDVQQFLGRHRVDGQWLHIQEPLPGCWICGVDDGHRMADCPKKKGETTICYRCGLRGVTIRTCPVHGKSWMGLQTFAGEHRSSKRGRF